MNPRWIFRFQRLAAPVGALVCLISINHSQAYQKSEMLNWASVNMKSRAPAAYKIYRGTSRSDFAQWLTGDDNNPVDDLLTAVHETAHKRTFSRNKYTLANGTDLPYPGNDRRLLKPSSVGRHFRSDHFGKLYLNGRGRTAASSNYDFGVFMDEFNCYVHDADLLNRLHPAVPKKWRTFSYWAGSEGLFAFMTFLKKYLSESKKDPQAWRALKERKYSAPVRQMWRLAEKVITRNCQMAGGKDKRRELASHMRRLCDGENEALEEILEGSSMACAQACLKTGTGKTPVVAKPRREIKKPVTDNQLLHKPMSKSSLKVQQADSRPQRRVNPNPLLNTDDSFFSFELMGNR